MPPVLGPSSPSQTRLKSCAGASGTTVCPSVTANSDTSGPSRNSSMTTRSQVAAWASASARSSVTTTPLPAARPSSFTTYGAPNSSSAAAASSGVEQTNDRDGRHARGRHHLLGERLGALELRGCRRRAEARDAARPHGVGGAGHQRRPRARPPPGRPRAPRPGPPPRAGRATSSGWVSTSCAMPALPGAASTAVTEGSAASERTRACSRAPPPTTRTLTASRTPTSAAPARHPGPRPGRTAPGSGRPPARRWPAATRAGRPRPRRRPRRPASAGGWASSR